MGTIPHKQNSCVVSFVILSSCVSEQHPDKRARYMDTYVVKNTEVHYHNSDDNIRFTNRLSSQNGGPIISQYKTMRNEVPVNPKDVPRSYEQNYLAPGARPVHVGPNPPPINFEEGNEGASAVAQSCEGAICINLRLGDELP